MSNFRREPADLVATESLVVKRRMEPNHHKQQCLSLVHLDGDWRIYCDDRLLWVDWTEADGTSMFDFISNEIRFANDWLINVALNENFKSPDGVLVNAVKKEGSPLTLRIIRSSKSAKIYQRAWFGWSADLVLVKSCHRRG